ncbi:hypothetical protein [Gordoniibacillus kamchatkensis]|uniref:hypothetical protein n=1 Tax=Gordoniibacillus kamchatkensis TaxID=1590651 RepID=UPI000696F05F|nr:hypothetical protein [Paenibacillus sp. VKM B-2647]
MIKLILWLMFLIPWASLLFMDRASIRKYMPVALLATVLNSIVNQLAWTYHWWTFNMTLFPWDKTMPLFTVYGVFLVGTMWIFRFTFRKFWVFFIVNMLVDAFYGFGLTVLLNTMGVRSNGTITPIQNLLLMTCIGLILYAFQLWYEGVIGGRENTRKASADERAKSPRPRVGSKAKAR